MRYLLALSLLFFTSCAQASFIPDTEGKVCLLANAIFYAEGGNNVVRDEHGHQYFYGIKSVHCTTQKECRAICINTINNNLIRYNEYIDQSLDVLEGTLTYLEFLQSRYAPLEGVTRSAYELNLHWIQNVQYYLMNPKDISD